MNMETIPFSPNVFGRGAAIDQPTLYSLIQIHNVFLHNIQRVDIYGLADIDIDRYFRNDMDDGDNISNSIREIFIDASDDHGDRFFTYLSAQ
jgi:hypothetical protein